MPNEPTNPGWVPAFEKVKRKYLTKIEDLLDSEIENAKELAGIIFRNIFNSHVTSFKPEGYNGKREIRRE